MVQIQKIHYATTSDDVLCSVLTQSASNANSQSVAVQLWAISLSPTTADFEIMSKFIMEQASSPSEHQFRQIRLVHTDGSDKVYIYDSEEVLYLWNPQINKVTNRCVISKVRAMVCNSEASQNTLYVLSHDGGQLQVLDGVTLELVTLFVSLEQELIEYTYDNDVLDLANLETSTIFEI